jgi:hypothetical protein
MKKIIFITIPVIILLIIGYYLYVYFQSFHAVTISFKQDDMSVAIYQQGDDAEEDIRGAAVKTLTKSEVVPLHDGLYYIVPKSPKTVSEPILLKVAGKDTTIDVNPEYSESYLKQLLKEKVDAIHTVIKKKYPSLINNYVIQEGELYKRGMWYGTTLVKNDSNRGDLNDFYRIVLQKKGDSWEVIGDPALVLTTAEYPTVPKDVLKYINQLGDA